MMVDVWFGFWIAHIVGDLAPNTRRNYRERYEYNVKPLIGGMQLADVKPMHCKMVFNAGIHGSAHGRNCEPVYA